MSRNLRIFIFAALIFATVGLMNDATVMYVLAGVCAAVILVAFLLSQLALTRLDVQMHALKGSSSQGSDLKPSLSVESIGSVTVGSAVIELAAENMTVEGADARRRIQLPPLPPGSGIDIDAKLWPPARGRYRVGPPVIVDSDPLGMFEGRSERGEAVEQLVFPSTYDVPRVASWDTGPAMNSARGRQVRRDRGEFRGIREHTPGDDLRHVHWKVTAHVGELAVKEYEPLRHDVISLHLDTSRDAHYGEGAHSTLETSISAAASIARAGLAEQRSVSVMGRGLPRATARPGSGQAHMHRIMVALAEAQPSEGPFADALSAQLRSVPRGATVFIITTSARDDLVQKISSSLGDLASVTLLIVQANMLDAPEDQVMRSRRMAEAARAAGIGAALLQSEADIAEALTTSTRSAPRRAGAM